METGLNETLSNEESLARSVLWSDDFVFNNPTQRLIAVIVVCLVTVIGVPGNSLVIFAVMLSKKLQNKTNIFVVNLACADLLTCAVLPFQVVALLSETWPLSHALCATVAILMWMGLGSCIVSLALIAFIRYSIITQSPSFNETLFTKTRLFFLVCGTWLLPLFLIVIPPAFGVGALDYSRHYKLCTADTSHPLSDIYAFVVVILEFPCLVTILLCYINVYRFLNKASFNMIQSGNRFTLTEVVKHPVRRLETSSEVALFRRQVQVTKKLFITVCTYIICVMPFGIACAIPAPIYPVIPWTYFLLFLSLCTNPIIYGLTHPQFKEVFQVIMKCSWKDIPEPSSLVTSLSNNVI